MKTKLMAITLAITTALSAGAAFADQNDDHRGGPQQNQLNDRRDGGGYQQQQSNDRRDSNYQQHQSNDRRDGDYQQHQSNDRRDNHQQDHHWNTPRYQQNHQAYRHDMPRPGQEWRRGGRVPYQYRGNEYQVRDWRSHDLPAPPRGHRWVRVNGDYVLIAIATGVIAQILLGGH
ncbi:RcnB family protein [Acinetobacter sp. ANC 4640]